MNIMTSVPHQLNDWRRRGILAAAFLLPALGLAFVLPAQAAKLQPYWGAPVQKTVTVTAAPGAEATVNLSFKNTGTTAWSSSGAHFVSIYTIKPSKHASVLRGSDWISGSQPARLATASVKTGSIGTVTFKVKAPAKSGTYTDTFQLSSEGVSWIWGAYATVKLVVSPAAVVKSPAAPRVTAKAWVVADAQTGAVVASYNPDVQRSIASLTKLTTIKVATRDLDLDLNQVVALASEDEVGGGRLRMSVGTPVLARDLVAAALAGSANNAANAIARATGLSRAQFVARMNQSVAAMGLTQTHFVEPTGIEAGNVSTAREVLKMSLDAFSNDLVLSMTSAPRYSIAVVDSSDVHDINNTNALVNDAAVDVVAGKTGFTYEAGYALTTRLAKAGKQDLIVVVLGSSTKNKSFSEAKALAQWAWKSKKW